MTTISYGDELGQEIKDDDNTKLIVSVVFKVLICIVGLFGNFIVIFIIVVLKEYQKSVTHWYVLQLALADSIFLLTLPFKVSEDLNHGWIYSNSACKTVQTILFMNYYGSIIFLMIMSIDRYIVVCHFFSDTLQRLRKRRIPYFVIVPSTWIIAILLCIPLVLYSHIRGESPNYKCSYEFPKTESHYIEICHKQGYRTESQIEDCLKKVTVDDDFNLNKPHYRMQTTFSNYNTLQTTSHDGNMTSSGETDYNGSSDYVEEYLNTFVNTNLSYSIQHSKDIQIIVAPNCNYWESPEEWQKFLIYNFVVMFILPALVMSVCYGLIVRKLSLSVAKTAPNTSTSSFTSSNRGSGGKIKRKKFSSQSKKDRLRVTTMCAALVSSFIICWLPFHSVHLAMIVGIPSSDETFCDILQLVGTLLSYLNSALNPFLYSFFSYNFGKRLSNASFKVKSSIRRQSSSTSVFGSVRQQKKHARDASRVKYNESTFTKKPVKKLAKDPYHQTGRLPSCDTQEQFRSNEEQRYHLFITTEHDDVVAAES